MFNNKTKMFLLLSLVFIAMVGISAVSATDVDDSASDITQISDTSDEIANIAEIDDNNKVIKQSNEQTSLSEGETGTLTDLNALISDEGTTSLTLDKDYASADGEVPIVISKDFTLDGNGKTIRATNGSFNITEGSTVTIKNVSILDKNGTNAMIFNSGTLNLINVTFNNIKSTNWANPAVLEAFTGSTTVLQDCSINNTCSTAAALRTSGNLDVNGCNITNVLSKNAPIANNARTAVININNTRIEDCIESNYGGAIYLNYAGITTINNSVFKHNQAGTRGGAMYAKGTITVENSVFEGNYLTNANVQQGGAIYIDSATTSLYLKNNTMTDNVAINGVDIYSVYNAKVNSTVNLNLENMAYDVEDDVVLTATVTDDMGNGIVGGSVVFVLNGNQYTATMNENVATYTVTAPLEEGELYDVVAVFSLTPAENQTTNVATLAYGPQYDIHDYTTFQSVYDSLEDSVIKLPSNITRAETETVITLNKDITIAGKDRVIDAAEGKMFEITNGATVTIANVTLTNGVTENLINIIDGKLVLDNVIIDNSTVTNTYNKYGLISVKTGSSLTINNSKIENIKGVVIDNMANTTIDNTIITNCNSLGNGNQPAIILEKGNMTIMNSDISDNQAYSGLIYSTTPSMQVTAQNGTLTIQNTNFENNVVTQGSSVVSVNNITTIDSSYFINNQATRTSGANASAITISNSVMTVTNSVFVNNTASGEVSTASAGYQGTLDISNSILLSNDNKPLVTVTSTSGKAILNNNYWGISDNPAHSRNNLVVTQIEEEDYWGDMEIVNLDVTVDNWVIFDASATEDPEDNFLFAIEGGLTKTNNTSGTVSDLEGTIPDYLTVKFETTAGALDDTEKTTENGVASTLYHAGMSDATITVSLLDESKTFDITAPEIIPNNYRGLQQLLDAQVDGATVELTMNVKRGSEENNVTIDGKNLIIDGKGFTINENDGRFLLLNNANVTLKNLIIKNAGTNYNPSVLQMWTGNLTLENVTIIDSTSNSGGALVYIAADSTATINNVTFANNTARFISNAGKTLINDTIVNATDASTSSMTYWGYNNGQLTINNSVFDSNKGYSAGFVSTSSGTLTIDNTAFINNTIVTSGNGVVLQNNGSLVINNSLFEDNYASSGTVKGIIFVYANSVVDNSIFRNNNINSNYARGLFYIDKSGTKLNITNSYFDNNYAKEGSVIYNYYGCFNISNSVILGNEDDVYILYTDWMTSYANNNWWGANTVPRSKFRLSGSYKIITDNWVIMEATCTEDGSPYTVTTTFNKVNDVNGTISDLNGSIPDGLEVSYETTPGTLASETTTVENGVTTNTITSDTLPMVTITQANEVIVLNAPNYVIITDETYPIYFDESGVPTSELAGIPEIRLSGTFNNRLFVLTEAVNLTTDVDQAILVNSTIYLTTGVEGTNVSALVINNTGYSDPAFYIGSVDGVKVFNNTIIVDNPAGDAKAFVLDEASNVVIDSNVINVTGICANIDYSEHMMWGFTNTSAVQAYNSSLNQITNNNISVTGVGGSTYSTITGIYIAGEFNMNTYDMCYSNENVISGNNIDLTCDAYAYAFETAGYSDDNIITDNNITVKAVNSYGITLNGPASDNTVSGNDINLDATEIGYGMYISTNNMGMVTDNDILDNNVTVKANDAYAIELYGADDNAISNNNLTCDGNYSIGIAGYMADGNMISENIITLTGNSSATATPSVDVIQPDNAGITFLTSDEETLSNDNTITKNVITVTDVANTTDTYAVKLQGSDNEVNNNTLVTNNLAGNEAVSGFESNVIGTNLPECNANIVVEDQTAIVGDEVVITATVTNNAGNPIKFGTVTITVDGTPVEVEFVEGTATASFTADEAKEYAIVATYVENEIYSEVSDEATITVDKIETTTTVTVENNVYNNTTISVSIKALDEDNTPITSGTFTIGDAIYQIDGENTVIPIVVDIIGANITVEYTGSDVYETSTGEVEVIPDKREVSLTSEITNTIVDSASMTVNVADSITEETNATGTVTVTVDGNDFVGTIDNGVAIVDLSDLAVGNYIATLTYDGDDYYAEKTIIGLIIEIEPRTTTTTVTAPETVKVGDDVEITATLIDNVDTAPLEGKTITFTINEEPVTKVTDEDGVATYTYVPAESGVLNVKASFADDDKYVGSEDETTVTVEILATTVTINANDEMNYGQTQQIFVQVVSEKGPISGKEVTVKINDDESTATVENGFTVVTFTPAVAGEYTIEVSLAEDAVYAAGSDSTTITVNKLSTTTSVSSIVTNVDNIETITVNVQTATGIVNEGSVEILLDGTSLATVNVSEGVVTYDVNFTESGKHKITVNYSGSDNYVESAANTNAIVNKYDVDVNANDVEGTVNTDIPLTVNVVNDEALDVNDGVVIITAKGEEIARASVSGGVATVNINLADKYTGIAKVAYSDSYKFNNAFTYIFIDVQTIGTTTTLDDISGRVGDSVTITANVVDEDGNAVDSGSVTFTDGNALDTTVAVSGGVASFDYVIPVEWIESTTVTATFTDSNAVYLTSVATTVPDVSKTSVSVTVDDVTDMVLNNVTIVANVVDDEGNAVNEGSIEFSIDGELVATVDVTDGVAEYTFTVKQADIGENTVSTTYKGTDVYTDSEAVESALTITTRPTVTTMLEVVGQAGNDVTLRVTVVDCDGKAFTGGRVGFKVNGNTLKDADGNVVHVNLVNGVASYTMTVDKTLVGDSTIVAIFGGNKIYASSRTDEVPFTVEKQDVTVIVAPVTAKVGDTITLTAYVVDSNGNPFTGGRVAFSTNKGVVTGDNGNTHTNLVDGFVMLTFTVPDTWFDSVTTIYATFGGNKYYNGAKSLQSNVTITQ